MKLILIGSPPSDHMADSNFGLLLMIIIFVAVEAYGLYAITQLM